MESSFESTDYHSSRPGGGSRWTEQGSEAVGWVVDEIDGRSRLVGRVEGLGGSGFPPEEKAINKLADHDGV